MPGGHAALSLFTVGWITFSISMIRGGVYGRVRPVLVIVGFFAA